MKEKQKNNLKIGIGFVAGFILALILLMPQSQFFRGQSVGLPGLEEEEPEVVEVEQVEVGTVVVEYIKNSIIIVQSINRTKIPSKIKNINRT